MDCLGLSQVEPLSQILQWLQRISTVGFTREGWGYWINTLQQVRFSGRMQFFNLQQHSHALSTCRPEFSVAMQVRAPHACIREAGDHCLRKEKFS